MSRTTNAQLRVLMREARTAMGLRTNKQLQSSLEPYNKALETALPAGSVAILITPYRDNRWLVYWVDPECREQIKPLNLDDLNLPPEQFARKYAVSKPGRRLGIDILRPPSSTHSIHPSR